MFVGIIIQSPTNFIYLPGQTPLPITLTCDISPGAGWRVNNQVYFISNLLMGSPQGHNVTGINIVIFTPMNGTRYACITGRADGDPYYIFVAGEYVYTVVCCIRATYVCVPTKLL